MCATNTLAVATVACADPDGQMCAHRVLVHPDGTVSTPDHDAAEWGHDQQVVAALGGPADTSACSWWATTAIDPDAGLRGRWYAGRFAADGRTPLHDVTSWQIARQGEWTEPAKRTTLNALGLGVAAGWTDDVLAGYLLPDPEAMLTVLRVVKPQLDDAERVYARPLAEAAAQLPDRDFADWIAAGIHYSWLYGFTHANVALPDAVEIAQEIERRNEHSRLDGEPGTWAMTLTGAGISPHRIARFLARTHDGGMVCDHLDAIADLRRDLPDTTETTWIAEAVCAVPDLAEIVRHMDRAYQQSVSNEWAATWVREVALPRAREMLIAHGDPDGWPPDDPEYWRWPARGDCPTPDMALNSSDVKDNE